MKQLADNAFAVADRAGRAPGWGMPSSVVRLPAAICLFEASFYFAYRYGMSFSHSTASPFWFPDSVLLCALLLAPRRLWWIFVLGTLPIRVATPEAEQIPGWFLLDAFLIDSLKSVLTALALRAFIADPLHLKSVKEYAIYCLLAVMMVPALAAIAGAGARVMLGHDYWTSWQQWFLGNSLTHLVVTPAILWGIPAAVRAFYDGRPVRWVESTLLAIGLVVSAFAAFNTAAGTSAFAEPLFYAPAPFLFWAAIRFGIAGASGAVAVISLVSIEAALAQHGPFAGRSPGDTALALQQFLLFRAAPLYLVAILVEQNMVSDKSLVESERRFRDVVDSQPELVCRFLPGGSLSFVNEAFCRAFRRERKSLVGSNFLDLLPANARDIARAQVAQAAFQEDAGQWECQAALPGGGAGWQHWVCRAVSGPFDEIVEFQAIGHDITDRKHAEESDRNLAHASRLAVVGELTAMVAHEINQPLAAILANADAAEILIDREDPPLAEIREILADIRRSDLRASEAVGRIKALLRKRETCMQPLDLNDAIADVLRLAAGDLMRRQVPVRSDLGAPLPRVLADRVQMQQVLLNLLVNAMDAMKETPLPKRLLEIRTRRAGDAIEVVVADSGHGIAPDQLAGIFSSFVTTKAEGMGLGLSIARSIVEMHHGRIWAENRAAGGAALHFTVKIAPLPQRAPSVERPDTRGSAGRRARAAAKSSVRG